MTSLNPTMRVGRQIAEVAGTESEAIRLLDAVGVPEPARRLKAFPHELSGGLRQRVMIAMAVAGEPSLVIADEPTTALDVTVQAQVLDLLRDLQRERGLAMMFITHSLPVVAEIADRVVVMYAGEIVEEGKVDTLFARPLHPYTAALLRSAPHEDGSLPVGIPGTVPQPHLLPPGCRFAPRCEHRRPVCETHPQLEEAGGRWTRCLRWRELVLA
jgi:peptide/nickel transport system permease protein